MFTKNNNLTFPTSILLSFADFRNLTSDFTKFQNPTSDLLSSADFRNPKFAFAENKNNCSIARIEILDKFPVFI